jgi:hypothetical protein
MTIKSSLGRFLLRFFLILVAGTTLMQASDTSDYQNGNTASAVASSNSSAALQGAWSGTFTSKNADISPFTITVVFASDSRGRLVGNASLVSECLKSHRLQVTVNGSNVVLAGSDADGDNVTFRGTLDNSGTLLTLNYILNGSAGRRCETDNGTGTLGKR